MNLVLRGSGSSTWIARMRNINMIFWCHFIAYWLSGRVSYSAGWVGIDFWSHPYVNTEYFSIDARQIGFQSVWRLRGIKLHHCTERRTPCIVILSSMLSDQAKKRFVVSDLCLFVLLIFLRQGFDYDQRGSSWYRHSTSQHGSQLWYTIDEWAWNIISQRWTRRGNLFASYWCVLNLFRNHKKVHSWTLLQVARGVLEGEESRSILCTTKRLGNRWIKLKRHLGDKLSGLRPLIWMSWRRSVIYSLLLWGYCWKMVFCRKWRKHWSRTIMNESCCFFSSFTFYISWWFHIFAVW